MYDPIPRHGGRILEKAKLVDHHMGATIGEQKGQHTSWNSCHSPHK